MFIICQDTLNLSLFKAVGPCYLFGFQNTTEMNFKFNSYIKDLTSSRSLYNLHQLHKNNYELNKHKADNDFPVKIRDHEYYLINAFNSVEDKSKQHVDLYKRHERESTSSIFVKPLESDCARRHMYLYAKCQQLCCSNNIVNIG